MTIPIRKYFLSIFLKEQTIFELEENIWAIDYIILTFFTENLLYNHDNDCPTNDSSYLDIVYTNTYTRYKCFLGKEKIINMRT